VAKVWVGGTLTNALELNLFIDAIRGLVVTGSRVSARKEMSTLVMRARVKRAS
jgi:hypothetical protein